MVQTKILLQNIQCLSNLIAMLWQSLITPWHCDEFCTGTQHSYFLQCVFPLSTIIFLSLRAVFFILAVTNYSTLSAGIISEGLWGGERGNSHYRGNSCSFPMRETSIRELSELCEQNSVWLKLELLVHSSEGQRSWDIFTKLPTTNVNHLTLHKLRKVFTVWMWN